MIKNAEFATLVENLIEVAKTAGYQRCIAEEYPGADAAASAADQNLYQVKNAFIKEIEKEFTHEI